MRQTKEQSIMTNMTVARSILDQLGGERFVAMTGARELVGSADSLTFKIGANPKRVSQVRVTLTPADLYSVTFFRIGKAPQIESDVHCGMLEAVFSERTGLYTQLLRAHHEQKVA
jgi:hypothetical protein